MKKSAFNVLVFIVFSSCATEKINSSPIPSAFTSSEITMEKAEISIKNSAKTNARAAELTNLCTKFPHFKNEKVNAEISVFRTSIQNYLYALEANNDKGMERELKKAKKSYANIQNLRKNLHKNEDEKLNSLMVKIKRNITFLEDNYSTSKK